MLKHHNPARHGLLAKTAIFAAALCLNTLFLVAPAQAAADGLPHLDPTNNNNGTMYTVTMVGSFKSMDQAFLDGNFTYRGTLLVFQDQGVADFNADMELDVNGDAQIDRTFNCSGFNGKGRFGMRCSANDGLGEIRLNIAGSAKLLDNGKLSLRKALGKGYTETTIVSFGFAATQQ